MLSVALLIEYDLLQRIILPTRGKHALTEL